MPSCPNRMPVKTDILQELTDNELMSTIQSGDLKPMDELYRRYRQEVYAYLLGIHRRQALAEDLLQMIFIRVMKYAHRYQNGTNFRHWLFRLAKNVSKDHFLVKSNRPTEDISKLYQWSAGGRIADQEIIRRESHQLLHQALEVLSPSEREVLVLSKLEGMKYVDIAEILDCSEGAVKVKVFRALKALRKVYLKLEKS